MWRVVVGAGTRAASGAAPLRVRFAPSPTGQLHLGGLRTALYNWLFAAARGGTLLLRLEDTDRARTVSGASAALQQTLAWAGLRCSEGPAEGGAYGPYVQSERLHIYRKHIEILLQNGTAYRCFCTDRRVDLLRRDAQRTRQIPKYDNKCRHLSVKEIENKLAANTPNCIRFKIVLSGIMWRVVVGAGTRAASGAAPLRVRFAPSPTGQLHLGGLRTALYNWLFAAARGGTLLLRLEDTDRARTVSGASAALQQTLAWAGLRCSEGPAEGGAYGPYVQSERLHIYRKHIEILLQNGTAYRCFCTDRRVDLLRRDAQRTRQIPKYDNKCRHLSVKEIENKLAANTPNCIRFKLTQECLSFEDLIFGGIAYDVTANEGDPVVMKSDGYPTYHFANVVDDHLMMITHVLRGVEWQISTTKHILLYRAFGWEPPSFGHLPLIVNADGTKLSKRQKDVTVHDYRQKGVLPLALVNYLTLAGGGFDHVPGEGVRMKTLEELADEFRLEKILPHPSRLNPDLLDECNRLEIVRLLKDSETSKALVQDVQNLVKDAFRNEQLQLSDEHVRSVLTWATSRITKLDNLVSPKFAYLWILPNGNCDIDSEKRELLLKVVGELQNVSPFDQLSVKSFMKEFSVKNGVKFQELMKTLRPVLSGLREGPSVAEMMELLGKETTLERLTRAAES